MPRCGAISFVVTSFLMVCGASAHGWVTKPISKNQMAYKHWVKGMPGGSFRYEPQSSANWQSCGAQNAAYMKGLGTWEKFYEKANVPIPTLVPGGEFELEVQLTADHGGQAWLMVACGDRIGEDVTWTYLERAPGDRGHHFMPNHPSVYAWKTQEYGYAKFRARYVVPHTLSCPGGNAVGRWLWKTGNTCLDVNNNGRKTESFSRAEYEKAIGEKKRIGTCKGSPETFISCFDFKVLAEGEEPAPTLPPLPSPSPTPAPLDPEPEPEPEPSPAPTPAPGPCGGEWQQCGGEGFNGPTCCKDGLTCIGTKWWASCKRASSSQVEESSVQHKVVQRSFLK